MRTGILKSAAAGFLCRRHRTPQCIFAAAIAALTALAASIGSNAQSYIPPIAITASTTLFSNGSTAISPGRVGVDRAGNVYYMVNGGSASTLMKIPAASPAITNTSPVALITGLGQYNADVAFVDVKGNLWLSPGNGTATNSGGGTDYYPLVEIPAVNGIPNTAGIPAGGMTYSQVDATSCTSTTTVPCTWPNYKLNTTTNVTGGSQVSGPQIADLYVDGAGNVYYLDVYDNNNTSTWRIVKTNIFTGAGAGTVLADGLPKHYNSQIAVDGAGNVYYMDANAGSVSLVNSNGSFTQAGNSASLGTAVEISSAQGIAADVYGNLYINSSTQLSEVPFEGSALNFSDEFGIASGLSANNIVWGGSVDVNGNYYYASYTNIAQLQIGGYNFGNVPVGTLVNSSSTPAPAPTLTAFFNAGLTVSGNYFPTGSPTSNISASLLQSFPYSGTKSIGGGSAWVPGQTGTIVMNFQPIHPGLLRGSYTPRDSSSNIEVTVNLQGVGQGPQAIFLPGAPSQLFTSAATSNTDLTPINLAAPSGIAVDTFGDIFVADTGNGKIAANCLAGTQNATGNSFCANSGYAGKVVELPESFSSPFAIALDGANSLYVLDNSSATVSVIQGDNLVSSILIPHGATFGGAQLDNPEAIALDGYGNIYIADTANNRIVKAHQFGAKVTDNSVYLDSTATIAGTPLNRPASLTVDSSGNLIVADTGNNRLVQVSPLGVASVVNLGSFVLNQPSGVASLPSGSLVVADTNGLSLIGNGSGQNLSMGSVGLGATLALALDLAGNIYVADAANNRVAELSVSSPATAADFPDTQQGQTGSSDDTSEVYNSGNADLTFSAAPALDAGDNNFGILGTSTCNNGVTVTAGSSCVLVTDFTPQASGQLAGTVTVSDNQLGYTLNTATANETGTFQSAGAQTIALSGKATNSLLQQTILFPQPASPLTYSSGLTVALSATGGASGNQVVFNVDGASTGAGTISGNTLTVTQAGNIVIDANQAGDSNYSAATQVQRTIVVSQAAQTITFPAPTSPVTYSSGLTVALSATGGASSSPVIFTVDQSSTGAGTISGGTMTVTQAGSIVIDANQAADSNYLAATQVQRTIVVSQAPQSIAFTAPTSPVMYTTAPITLSATANSGLAVTFSVTSGPATVSGNQLTITGVGTVVVTASQTGNLNYLAATPAPQTIVVTQASQSISFTPLATPIPYTTASIALSANASSGLAVAFAVTSGPATVNGNQLTITGVGTVMVAASQTGNANYLAATPASQSIVVTQAPQTIAFTPPSSPLAFTVSPIVLNATSSSGLTVTFSVTSGPATISGNQLTLTGTGTVVIAANQSGNANYAAAPAVPATFVVPGFSLALDSTSLNIKTGQPGTINLTIASQSGFSSPVTFTCTGLPAGAACSFNPSTVTPTASGTVTTQLTIQSGQITEMNRLPGPGRSLPATALALALGFFGWRKRRGIQIFLLLAMVSLGIGALSGCGGTPHLATPVTVTAASGQFTQSITISLTVE